METTLEPMILVCVSVRACICVASEHLLSLAGYRASGSSHSIPFEASSGPWITVAGPMV